MTERKIKIAGKTVTVFKMVVPDVSHAGRGRPKSFERSLIEALKPGEATDLFPLARQEGLNTFAQNAKRETGKTYAIRREGNGVRVYCTGKARSNVLNLTRQMIAA